MDTAGVPGEAAGLSPTEAELAALAGTLALVEAGSLEVTGRVASFEAGSLIVDCDEELAAGAYEEKVNVSVFAEAALYRVWGPAVLSGLRVTTGADAVVERIQRRRWPRRRLNLAATLCPVAEGVRLEGVPGRTVDLSIGGLCVETLRPMEGVDPLVILSLPDGTSLVCGATTVAADDLGDGWRYRLAFRDLDSGDAGRLAELTQG